MLYITKKHWLYLVGNMLWGNSRGNIRHLNKSENNDTATASSTFFSGLYNDNLFRTGLTNVENRRNSFFNLLRMAIPDGYSGLCQISRMEYFSKSSTLDTWQGSEYAPLFFTLDTYMKKKPLRPLLWMGFNRLFLVTATSRR